MKEIKNFIAESQYCKDLKNAVEFDSETEKGVEIHIYHNCELWNRHDYKTENKDVYIFNKSTKKYRKITNEDSYTVEFLKELTKFVKK